MEVLPSFLPGAYTRGWIKRPAGPDGELDDTVKVLYVQTPLAFVDVRTPKIPGSHSGAMEFAGVTSVVVPSESSSLSTGQGAHASGLSSHPLIRWHSCLNYDPPVPDSESCWVDALTHGKPRPTEDEGVWIKTPNTNIFQEIAPDNSLEEEWHKVYDGNEFFAARLSLSSSESGNNDASTHHHSAVLVVAGGYFGFAEDGTTPPDHGRHARYLAGTVSVEKGWCVTHHLVHTTESDSTKEDKAEEESNVLSVPGSKDHWQILPGTSLDWKALPKLKFELPCSTQCVVDEAA